MRGGISALVSILVASIFSSTSGGAVALGQVDDFQDGTLQGWDGGSFLVNQPTGGPAGAGDRFLDIDALNFALGSFNATQWSGDYVAAGVENVRFDVDNAGPDSVSLRLMIFTPGCGAGAGGCTAWTTTNATVLAAGSGWQTITFALTDAEMTQVLGTDSLADALLDVERILIRHDDGAPDPPGVSVTVDAVLGIDNVTALPEPGRLALFTGGVAVAGLARRRHRREDDA